MTRNKFLLVLLAALPLVASTISYSPAAENLLPLPGQLVPTTPFTQPLDAYLDGVNQYQFNAGSTLLCYFRPPPYQFQEVCQSQIAPFLPLNIGLPPVAPPPPPPPIIPPQPPIHHHHPSPVPEPRWGFLAALFLILAVGHFANNHLRRFTQMVKLLSVLLIAASGLFAQATAGLVTIQCNAAQSQEYATLLGQPSSGQYFMVIAYNLPATVESVRFDITYTDANGKSVNEIKWADRDANGTAIYAQGFPAADPALDQFTGLTVHATQLSVTGQQLSVP